MSGIDLSSEWDREVMMRYEEKMGIFMGWMKGHRTSRIIPIFVNSILKIHGTFKLVFSFP